MFLKSSRFFAAALLALAAPGMWAKTVSAADARIVADEFFASVNNGSAPALKLVQTAGKPEKPLYYIFNAENGKGFVIISADDCTEPVVGYSLTSAMPVKATPAAMQWALDGYGSEIKAAPGLQPSISLEQRRAMARKAAPRRAPKVLATPNWRQEAPFNKDIPGQPLTGCVGTAMAMIMKYHQWPVQGSGSYGGVDFGAVYDWANMRMDNYRYGYSAAEGQAVATLMHHTTKSVDTQYGYSGSSAYEVRVPAALSNYFGYDPAVSFKKRSDVATQAQWDNLVKAEIDANRPVLYCGQDVTAGHAFVCDGYDAQGMLHFNWGWGGDANGYFRSTMLNPTVSRTHYYNNLQTVIYNIKPLRDGSRWSTLHITNDGAQPGIGSDMANLAAGGTFTVRAGNFKTLAFDDFNGHIAVALYNAAGAMKGLLSDKRGFSLKSMQNPDPGYITIGGCSLRGGLVVEAGDVVRIAASTDGGATWLPVAGEMNTVAAMDANRVAPDYFDINLPQGVSGVTAEGANRVIPGWDYTFTAVLANPAVDVLTVKANGFVLTGNNGRFTIPNVCEPQTITLLVQKAADVVAKRSFWVETPGTLSQVVPETESGSIRDLTLFGSIDARDFEFMRTRMKLNRLDISACYIAAYDYNKASALPYNAFQDCGALSQVELPSSLNTIHNGAFRYSGITSIKIPGNVSKYDYNVFLGCYRLRDIWVGRERAEFINWCVLSGCNKGAMTLHVPTQAAVNNYRAKDNWKEIANIVVDPMPAVNDYAFAVMEDAAVKYESDTQPGRLAKGSVVRFKATHIADSDDRMEVYANSTKLTMDAEGYYTAAVNGNTIVHFGLVKPMAHSGGASFWKLGNVGGATGLVTDAVNVIPGKDFDVQINGLQISQEAAQVYWAMALTDAQGNIKEFISPVGMSALGTGNAVKANVRCCVRESQVRPGNQIRLVTSFTKKYWDLVPAVNSDVCAAINAVNHQTPVYNITVNYTEGSQEKLNVSGLVETAAHGRDLNFKIAAKSVADRVNISINGEPVYVEQQAVLHNCYAKGNMTIDVDVVPFKISNETTIVLAPGEYLYKTYNQTATGDAGEWQRFNAARVAQLKNPLGQVYSKVTIKGALDYTDFNLFRENKEIREGIKELDLSGATIKVSRDASSAATYPANNFPACAFCYPVQQEAQNAGIYIALEDIKLPAGITIIQASAFKYCSKLRELTLPTSLLNGIGTTKTGLKANILQGCTSFETFYVPCAPVNVSGYTNVLNHIYFANTSDNNKLGLADPSKVTVVVKPEYLNVYRTPAEKLMSTSVMYRNGWAYYKFNIVSEYPVYSLDYDASQLYVAKGKELDCDRAASFLKDDVVLESKTLSNVLYIGALSQAARPDGCGATAYDATRTRDKVQVYDNDKLMPAEAINADGSVNVTYYNTAKRPELSGNHDIRVVLLNDVRFSTSSALFSIEPQLAEGQQLQQVDEQTKVLANLPQGSEPVRFKVTVDAAAAKAGSIEARVKVDGQVVAADEDGMYSVAPNKAVSTVEVFAVPVNGASLNPQEFASIDAKEANNITAIALTGDVTPQMLATVKESFTSLSNLDLSGMTGNLPADAIAGMSTLTSVTLPAGATQVCANTFKGCTALATVNVPETVTSIEASAFDGCSALQTVVLTGVENIASGAFNGCSNLTAVTINNSAAGSGAKARSMRKAVTMDNAFSGANPNVIVTLDEGMTAPAAKGNWVLTSQGMVTSVVNGEAVEMPGRVYTAAANINLEAGKPLNIPNDMKLGADNEIAISVPVAGQGFWKPGMIGVEMSPWSPLILPFDATEVTLESDGSILKPSNSWYGDMQAHLYTVVLPDGTQTVFTRQQKALKANTPYLVRIGATPQNLRVVGKGVKVAATPADIRYKANGFDLVATYNAASIPARAYVLNEAGTAFEQRAVSAPEDVELPAQAVNAYTVYAESPNDLLTIPVDLGLVPTGVEDITVDDNAQSGADVWYNMQGVRVDKPTAPGLYVRGNGTKVVIK